MNFSIDFYDQSQQEHSLCYLGVYFQPESLNQQAIMLQNPLFQRNMDLEYILYSQTPKQQELIPSQSRNSPIQSARRKEIEGNKMLKRNVKMGNRKKECLKPSPYHNYQKHLNIALKKIVRVPEQTLDDPISISVAHQLWKIFLSNPSKTKKILHFIFNEFNQYRIKASDLVQFGFRDIYGSYETRILSQAKIYLTHLAIQQLNDANIDLYLRATRIKNHQQFKKYLLLFCQELQDGFLKKRFTNLSRKEKMHKQFLRNQ